MPLASITHSITSFVGDHGIYAVFGLMAVDAVFPAASELVMVYGGALAAGAFPGSQVVLFGTHDRLAVLGLRGGLPGRHARLPARVDHRLGIGAYGGRPLIEGRGRWLHLTPENSRPRRGAGSTAAATRPSSSGG